VKSAIPDREDQFGGVKCKSAGEVDCVSAPESALSGKLPRMLLDVHRQLDGSSRAPVLLPHRCSKTQSARGELAIARRCGKGRSNLGVREPAGHRCVAAVPELGGEITAILLDDEHHEGARVEVDKGHLSAALLADDVGDRRSRPCATPALRSRPSCIRGAPDNPRFGQALQRLSSIDAMQPGNWDPAVGHDDLAPTLARSSQSLRWARNSLTATSMPVVYMRHVTICTYPSTSASDLGAPAGWVGHHSGRSCTGA